MFNKTISSLFVLSLLHTSPAFCMEIEYSKDDKGHSPFKLQSLTSSTQEDTQKTPLINKEDYQKDCDDLKKNILEVKEYEEVKKSVEKFIESIGINHPLTEDLIQLMVDHTHVKDSNSIDPLEIHLGLLKKINEPAIHHPSTATLKDGRKLRFSSKSFQAPKMAKLPTVQPEELLRLTLKLIEEIETNSANLPSLKNNANSPTLLDIVMQQLNVVNVWPDPQLMSDLIEEMKTNSTKLFPIEKKSNLTKLLDTLEQDHKKFNSILKMLESNPQGVTFQEEISYSTKLLVVARNSFLIDFLINDSSVNFIVRIRLRSLLLKAKELEEKNSTNVSVPESDSGLSEVSNIIFSLLLNVTTCDTGVENGIDVAYRLITEGPRVSEHRMERERRKEQTKEMILQELDKVKEGLLNGEGPVVAHFDHNNDEEQTVHTATYLKKLLGHHIGTLFEGEKLSIDEDASSVSGEVREASLQKVLDSFHSHYTPDKVISHFLDKINEGKWVTSEHISSMIDSNDLEDNKYAFFINDDPDEGFEIDKNGLMKWKPMVAAELLLRLGILEEVSK